LHARAIVVAKVVAAAAKKMNPQKMPERTSLQGTFAAAVAASHYYFLVRDHDRVHGPALADFGRRRRRPSWCCRCFDHDLDHDRHGLVAHSQRSQSLLAVVAAADAVAFVTRYKKRSNLTRVI